MEMLLNITSTLNGSKIYDNILITWISSCMVLSMKQETLIFYLLQ
jgi:hypothetical protein